MSRILSQRLVGCLQRRAAVVGNDPQPLLLQFRRRFSSSKPQIVDVEMEDGLSVTQKLEKIIHLHKSTPDWLPFVPGSSFWVPPHHRTTPLAASPFLLNSSNKLNREESLSLTTDRGCPSSAYFIHPDCVSGVTVQVNVLNGEKVEMVGNKADLYVEEEEGNQMDWEVVVQISTDFDPQDGER